MTERLTVRVFVKLALGVGDNFISHPFQSRAVTKTTEAPGLAVVGARPNRKLAGWDIN
jgi:hypothetical protein